MFKQFIRAVVSIITSAFKSKNGDSEDKAAQYGVPFSFKPVSIDIHRCIREEAEAMESRTNADR